MIDEDSLQRLEKRNGAIFTQLDERQGRIFAAVEARAAGHGGIAAGSRVTRIAASTIGRGLKELDAPPPLPPGGVRRPGGGRKSLTETDPSLLDDLNALYFSGHGLPVLPSIWMVNGWCMKRLQQENFGQAGASRCGPNPAAASPIGSPPRPDVFLIRARRIASEGRLPPHLCQLAPRRRNPIVTHSARPADPNPPGARCNPAPVPPKAAPLVGASGPTTDRTVIALSGGIDVIECATSAALPTVTGFAVRCAIAALRKHDVATWPLLHHAGLSEQGSVSPKHRVSAKIQGEFLEYAAEAAGDSALTSQSSRISPGAGRSSTSRSS